LRRLLQLALVVTLTGLLVGVGMRPFPALPRHHHHSLSRVVSSSTPSNSPDVPDFRASVVGLLALTLGLICVFQPSPEGWHQPRQEDFSQFVRPPPSH
jgi:hypothetical protein